MDSSQTRKKESPFEAFRGIVSAIFLAIALRTMLFEPFVIPSSSMVPTLWVGDFLFVSKFSYGWTRFSIPFGYIIPYFSGRIFSNAKPQRGDVVVFRTPDKPDTNYVKRVIGLPGDKIQLKGGQVYINDTPATYEKIDNFEAHSGSDQDRYIMKAVRYKETLPGGHAHTINMQKPFGTHEADETPPYHVPAGHYFMLGDNRHGSSDSRFFRDMGFIHEDYLIGKAQIIFFSLPGDVRWWQIWFWPTHIRWGRLLNWIH